METKERNIKNTKNAKSDKLITSEKGDSLKFSFRFGSSASSITLSKKICSLYILLCSSELMSKDKYNKHYEFIQNCVNESLNSWEGESCKGLSEFITMKMIAEMLEKDDFDQYMLIYSKLSKS